MKGLFCTCSLHSARILPGDSERVPEGLDQLNRDRDRDRDRECTLLVELAAVSQ
jgi:hypothetical protein